MTRLIDELASAVGADHVLTEPDLKATYETDWTRRWSGISTAAVRPANTAEVAAVVSACSRAGVGVVPQGGNTGLVGGSVPGHGQPVIVSLRRLDSVLVGDSGRVRAGAGATLEKVQDAVAGSGWDVGVDLAARSSATIGGMIATNAGGIRVLRDGMMRRQLVGLTTVLASGEVLSSMRGLAKDNTGYDLIGLMCGSEGTLGIITEAILQLIPTRPNRAVALFGVESLAAAADQVEQLRPQLRSLEAAEYMSAACMDLVCAQHGVAQPVPGEHGGYLLLECAGLQDPVEEMTPALGELEEVAVGIDSTTRQELWAYREGLTESIAGRGIPQKLDVTVPTGRMGRFEEDLGDLLGEIEPGGELFLFGHIADGGLHINVVTDHDPDESLDEAILELVARHGGSISAEHGIGRSKVSSLPLNRSNAELAAMRALKTALDPDGILNPGVVFSEAPRCQAVCE